MQNLKQKIRTNRRLLVIIGIALVGVTTVLVVVGMTRPTNKNLAPQNAKFRCYTYVATGTARCSVPGETCLGRYSLRGNTPENGLNTAASGSTTCEGISGGDVMYYDSQGNYLGKIHEKPYRIR